ncbi:MAG TPA: hypothetical protein VFZ59_14995 [Verrucomicrobiae bacterium]|nr:hypothetical protein [Verrucomicrobiae bacterium]
MPLNFRPVGGGQDQNRQLASSEILLIPQILIGGDKDIEAPFGGTQQITVLQVRPA